MRRDAVLLVEIIGAIDRILEITSATSAMEIEGVPDRRDSLLWNFTVLGEAVSQLSTELKARHPAVPWSDASRTRNRIVHGYTGAFAISSRARILVGPFCEGEPSPPGPPSLASSTSEFPTRNPAVDPWIGGPSPVTSVTRSVLPWLRRSDESLCAHRPAPVRPTPPADPGAMMARWN